MGARKYLLIATATLLAGCETVQHTTPSGRPEVTIAAPIDQVKTAYVGILTNRGYSLTRDTNFQIVMERQVDNVMANVLLASNYDPTVEARLTSTFMEMGTGTRVTTDMGIVRNGGSAFEAVTPMNNHQDSAGVQRMLTDLKAALESGKSVAETVASVTLR